MSEYIIDPKLIDAYELEREMYRRCIDTDIEINKGRAKWDSGLWIRYKVFEDAITVASRVEAEPVKHGRWVTLDDEYIDECKCSSCGVYEYFNKGWKRFNYCPNCGSRMDSDGDAE